MNKHLFKSLQEDKKEELNELHDKYHRLSEFYNYSYKRQIDNHLTLSQYNCFWSWYYNSNISAREAYKRVFED